MTSNEIPTLRNDFEPFEQQRLFYSSTARFRVAVSGARGGKTIIGAAALLDAIWERALLNLNNPMLRRSPLVHAWVVAPIWSLLGEPFRCILDQLGGPQGPLVEWYSESKRVLRLKGGILIEGKSAEHPDRLVSVGLDVLWIDELARVKRDAWLGQLRQRLTDKQGRFIGTTTPLGRNWAYDIWKMGQPGDQKVDNYESFSWTTKDNPINDPKDIENARATLPDSYFRREYEASFDSFSGLIYDMFRRDTHVLDERQLRQRMGLGADQPLRDGFRRVIGGMDFGFIAPGCLLTLGEITPGQLAVVDEVYATEKIFYEPREDDSWCKLAEERSKRFNIDHIRCDSAEPDKISDLKRSGVTARIAKKDVLWGIRKVSEALNVVRGVPGLVVLDSCTNLIREIEAYAREPERGAIDSFNDDPASGQSDHALDALRYAVVELNRNVDLSDPPPQAPPAPTDVFSRPTAQHDDGTGWD